VRVLLDTHVAVWMAVDPGRLQAATREVLSDPGTTRLWSAASSWELTIKWRSGKLRMPEEPSTWIPRMLAELATESLPIRHDHAIRAGALPDHHRDPFDRMLVAQAELEQAALVTADRRLSRYDIEVIAAA